MKKIILLILLVIVLVSCQENKEKELTLPKGYVLLCSLERDKYTLGDPKTTWRCSEVFNNKRDAIQFAIDMEKMKESDKYQWNECK